MTTKAITLKNYHKAPTADLEAAADSLAELVNDPEVDYEDPASAAAYTLMDAIERELDARELEASLPAHDDTYSLQDHGIFLGSYES
jgi:hypothetical protein